MILDLSVVIPAKNEAKNLEVLIPKLKKQGVNEIIVADANSTDNTLNVCKKHNIIVVKGGIPSVGRNAGGRKSSHRIILFLDADVGLPKQFIKNLYSKFIKANVGVASVYLTPKEKTKKYKFLISANNFLMNFLNSMNKPHAFGACIICTKKAFTQSKGFNEKIVFAEDIEFVDRVSKQHGFELFSSPKIIYSMRRFEKVGTAKHVFNSYKKIVSRLINGEFVGKRSKLAADYFSE